MTSKIAMAGLGFPLRQEVTPPTTIVGTEVLLTPEDLKVQLGPLYSNMKKLETKLLRQIELLEEENRLLRRTTLIPPLFPLTIEGDTPPKGMSLIDVARSTEDYATCYYLGSTDVEQYLCIYACLYSIEKYKTELVGDNYTDYFRLVISRRPAILAEMSRKAYESGLTILEWLNTDRSIEPFRQPHRVKRDSSPTRSSEL